MDHEALIASVGASRYREACEAARADSVRADYGRGEPTFNSDIPLELFDQVWESELPHSRKLDLVLKLYDEMPCYSYLSSLSMWFSDLGSNVRARFWKWVRSKLSSDDPAFPPPVAYSLWCDFFENSKTVEEAWSEVARTDLPDSALQLVLIHSGPVPFPLKRALYQRLLPQERWHYYIFRSLLHSEFDVNGDIDHEEAGRVLSRLGIPADTEHLDKLRAKLR